MKPRPAIGTPNRFRSSGIEMEVTNTNLRDKMDVNTRPPNDAARMAPRTDTGR